jgi:ribosomal protein S18 acetylase RimI-like enzyme
VLRDESRGFYLLAESEGGPVGQLALTYEWSDWRNAVFWWLQSVYVRPEFRRQGVLRSLYDRVLKLGADKGVCGVRLYVERNNVSAQEAYRRLGLARAVFHMYEVDFVLDREHGD